MIACLYNLELLKPLLGPDLLVKYEAPLRDQINGNASIEKINQNRE
jgi:hypothetical protein